VPTFDDTPHLTRQAWRTKKCHLSEKKSVFFSNQLSEPSSSAQTRPRPVSLLLQSVCESSSDILPFPFCTLPRSVRFPAGKYPLRLGLPASAPKAHIPHSLSLTAILRTGLPSPLQVEEVDSKLFSSFLSSLLLAALSFFLAKKETTKRKEKKSFALFFFSQK